MQRSLSAPGKLFLSGEYAVLWGGVARVVAVAPRGTATVRRRDDREVHLLLEEGRLHGKTTPLGVRWVDTVSPPFAFAARAIDEALRAHGKEALGFELALAPSGKGAGGQKLGLGSSARAVVLAREACRYVLDARFDALKLALHTHSQAQGGRGSGADVAACFAGGVIRYRRFPVESLAKAAAQNRFPAALLTAPPVDLYRMPPPTMSLLYAFTGQSASTTGLLAQVEASSLGSPEARQRFVEQSDALGQSLEEGMHKGDLPLLRESAEALQALLAGLGPLETEPMQQLLALGRAFGAAGKLSGAGGGDGCIFFCADDSARQALADAIDARGFLTVPVSPEPGMRGETAPDPRVEAWLAS